PNDHRAARRAARGSAGASRGRFRQGLASSKMTRTVSRGLPGLFAVVVRLETGRRGGRAQWLRFRLICAARAVWLFRDAMCALAEICTIPPTGDNRSGPRGACFPTCPAYPWLGPEPEGIFVTSIRPAFMGCHVVKLSLIRCQPGGVKGTV